MPETHLFLNTHMTTASDEGFQYVVIPDSGEPRIFNPICTERHINEDLFRQVLLKHEENYNYSRHRHTCRCDWMAPDSAANNMTDSHAAWVQHILDTAAAESGIVEGPTIDA